MHHILIAALLLLTLGAASGAPTLGAETEPAAAPAPATSTRLTEDGIFPKAFKIPGTEVYVAFGGFAKVDFNQDFDAIGNAYEFQTNSIPVEGSAAADQDGLTTIHARETRLSVDFRSKAPQGEFRAYFEGDFFGENGDFRMRHAYGEFGRILGGQTWTTFMDFSARPLTVDYEGPDAEVFVRQAMIRYTQKLSEHWTWAIAVENPSPQFVVPAGLTGSARSDIPDLPTHFRYQADKGHIQMAGILRRIRFDGEQGSPDMTATGWGLNLTFSAKTWRDDEVMGQVAYGEGIARYIESFNGQNVDAVITPANEIETLPVSAAVIGYIHHWSERLRSGVALAMAKLDPEDSQAGTTIESTRDARLNLIWTPYRLVDYSAEVLYGRRENIDGSEGDAFRLMFALTYRFN